MSIDIDACLKGLPARLKIGAYDWAIVVVPGADGELHGQADFQAKQIRIWPETFTSPDHAAGIVLHEALHVIYDVQGLENLKRNKEAREEQIITGFEGGLVSLFRDNPRFMRWLGKWLR